MLYELINPSDPITFRADTFEAAAMATLMVGSGKYGARPLPAAGEPPGEEVPIFLLGGLEAWVAQRWGKAHAEDLSVLLEENREGIVAALRSFVLAGNREDYETGAAHAPSRESFRREWNERKRSSLSDICGYADKLADVLASRASQGAE